MAHWQRYFESKFISFAHTAFVIVMASAQLHWLPTPASCFLILAYAFDTWRKSNKLKWWPWRGRTCWARLWMRWTSCQYLAYLLLFCDCHSCHHLPTVCSQLYKLYDFVLSNFSKWSLNNQDYWKHWSTAHLWQDHLHHLTFGWCWIYYDTSCPFICFTLF